MTYTEYSQIYSPEHGSGGLIIMEHSLAFFSPGCFIECKYSDISSTRLVASQQTIEVVLSVSVSLYHFVPRDKENCCELANQARKEIEFYRIQEREHCDQADDETEIVGGNTDNPVVGDGYSDALSVHSDVTEDTEEVQASRGMDASCPAVGEGCSCDISAMSDVTTPTEQAEEEEQGEISYYSMDESGESDDVGMDDFFVDYGHLRLMECLEHDDDEALVAVENYVPCADDDVGCDQQRYLISAE
ncbi:expressed unknown protein [Seminavis robusta]|uniref:Uncharacterized protein n=1 Tax=Seminavis robusta TaxID=568900 RepID=A0A9N8DG18_9STRA|nr:expressed unknown protein [Seminavis robusta]|eukprot:Sro101_g051700.1 n/a (246) ;mRNA; f:81022-81759